MITLQTIHPRKQFASGGNNRTTIVRNPRTNEEIRFQNRQDANNYITNNYNDPNFHQGNLPELVVRGRKKRSLWEQGISNFEETFNLTPKEAISLLPYIGDAIDGYDIYNNLNNEEYTTAAINAGLLAAPNIIEKPAKWLFRSIKNSTKRGLRTINAIKNGRYYPLMTKKQRTRYEQNILNRTKEVNDFLTPVFNENLYRMQLSNRFDGNLIGNNQLPILRLTENNGRNGAAFMPNWNQINITKFEPNSKIYKNLDEIGSLYSHELGHYFNTRTPYTNNITLFDRNYNYDIPNLNHPDINIFRPIIENNRLINSPKNRLDLMKHLWQSSPNEAHAELYRHRWLNRNNSVNGYINERALGKENFDAVVFDFQNKFNLTKDEATEMILNMQRTGFKYGGKISLQNI